MLPKQQEKGTLDTIDENAIWFNFVGTAQEGSQIIINSATVGIYLSICLQSK